MATSRSPLKTIGLLLLFMIDYAASGQTSDVLSNIYKKAAKENRPLILVLDNSKNSDNLNRKTRDSKNSYKSLFYSPKKTYNPETYSALGNYRDKDGDNLKPFLSSLLQNYGQKSSQNRYQSSNPDKIDSSRSERRERRKRRRERRLRSQTNLLLRTQPEKDDRDKRGDRNHIHNLDKHEYHHREDHDRHTRVQNNRDSHERTRDDDRRDRYRHDHDRDRHDHDRNDRDRHDHDRHDRDRHDHDRHGHGREDYTVKTFIEKKYRGARDSYEVERDENRDRTLRTSVVKKLLRAAGNLSCDAQDECADTCGGSYDSNGKQEECEEACAEKFDCDDKEEKDHKGQEEIAGESCDFADSCAETGESSDNPSTRGVHIEDEEEAEEKKIRKKRRN